MREFWSVSLINQKASDTLWEVLIDGEMLSQNEVLQEAFPQGSVFR